MTTPAPLAAHLMSDPTDEPAPGEAVLPWGGAAGLPRRPVVKCPRCLTVATDDDVRCAACRAPLGDDAAAPMPVDRGRRAARLGLLCLALGAALGPLVGNGTPLVPVSAGGATVNLLLWACLGGGLGAAAGYALGWSKLRLR